MNKCHFNKFKRNVKPILDSYNIKKAAVFGSFIKGPFRKNSDIDFVIEFKGEKSLLDLAALKIDLEDLLKRRVDVLTYKSLHHLLKNRILNEQKIIYG